jgi:hypothetical protein
VKKKIWQKMQNLGIVSEQQVQQIYNELITNPAALQNGKKILEDAFNSSANFGTLSIELLVKNSDNPKQSIYLGALIRSILRENWQSSATLHEQKGVMILMCRR